MPSTSGRTTIGTWTAAAMATASSAERDQQSPAPLAEPIQPDRDERVARSNRAVGSTPRTSIAAPAMARAKATTGIATKSPTIPARAAPAGSAMSTIAGWMWTVLL